MVPAFWMLPLRVPLPLMPRVAPVPTLTAPAPLMVPALQVLAEPDRVSVAPAPTDSVPDPIADSVPGSVTDVLKLNVPLPTSYVPPVPVRVAPVLNVVELPPKGTRTVVPLAVRSSPVIVALRWNSSTPVC